jgi:hypothetical protein
VTADHEHDDMPPLLRKLLSDSEFQAAHITADELGDLLGVGGLRGLLDVVERAQEPTMPKRGTPWYREVLEVGTQETNVLGLINGIHDLWRTYGWPALVDFMELMIKNMGEQSPHLARDAYGNVQLGKLLKTNHTEAELMETAVHISNNPSNEYTMDFTEALESGQRIARTVGSWIPGLQNALNAASRGDMDGVRPCLVQLPGLRGPDADTEAIAQGVLVLSLAHMAVVNPLAALDTLHSPLL